MWSSIPATNLQGSSGLITLKARIPLLQSNYPTTEVRVLIFLLQLYSLLIVLINSNIDLCLSVSYTESGIQLQTSGCNGGALQEWRIL